MGEARGGGTLGDVEPAPALVTGRSCGTCSLCCKVLAVEALNKPSGQWCVHAAPGRGCQIHEARPQACREFFCVWLTDPNLGPEWKPEVARFVLSSDSQHRALVVLADAGMPLAWKREPYCGALRRMSESLFRLDRKVLVNLRGQVTVVLPDREVALGVLPPGEDIVIWREGHTYGAALRRDLPREPSSGTQGGRMRPQSSIGGRAQPAEATPAIDEQDFLRSVFREAVEKTHSLLDNPKVDDLSALAQILASRNRVFDETADSHARAGRAECQAGCVSCCYLMVMGAPIEILGIARQLLETRTPAEIEVIKQRLRRVADIPFDPVLRVRSRTPCGLLENGRCIAYDRRPSVCRMALSQSRAACDSCLQGNGAVIPYIEQPSKIAAVMQAGIDHALITRRNLSTEGAELGRALLIALDDYQGTLKRWLGGDDPFPGAHLAPGGALSGRERAMAAARRFGADAPSDPILPGGSTMS